MSALIPTAVKLSQQATQTETKAGNCPSLPSNVALPVIKHAKICQGQNCAESGKLLEINSGNFLTVTFTSLNVSKVKVNYRVQNADGSVGSWQDGAFSDSLVNSLTFQPPSQAGQYQVLVAGYDQDCNWSCSNKTYYTQGSCGSAPVYCPFDGSGFGCNNTPFLIKVLPAVAKTQSASASTSTPTPAPTKVPQGSKACQVNIESFVVGAAGATIKGKITTQRARCNNHPPQLYLVAENGKKISQVVGDFVTEENYGGFYQYRLYGYSQETWQKTTKNRGFQEFSLPFWGNPQTQSLVFTNIPDGKYHLFCQEKEDFMVNYNPTIWYGLCDWVDTGNPYCAVNGGSRGDAGLCGSAWSSGPGSSAEFEIVHLTPTFTPIPTSTPRPTNTPYIPTPFLSLTPRPTSVPRPTATLRPTSTIRPTSTPIPTMTTRPTSTPLPTSTLRPSPTPTSFIFRDCSICPLEIQTFSDCYASQEASCLVYDMNSDGIINIFDIVRCASFCGTYSVPTPTSASVSSQAVTAPVPVSTSGNFWTKAREFFMNLF